MGQTESNSILIFSFAFALFGFFVVAPMILNAVSMFTVQKKFAEQMVEEGVITEADYQKIHPVKRNAGVITASIVTLALIGGCFNKGMMGILCAAIPTLAGFMKYRRVLEYNNITVQRFRNTYRTVMDEKKYNKFVDKNF